MKKYKNIFFILMTIFAILAQLVNPTLVYADGETPLPPTEIATEAAPTENPSVTDLPTQLDGLATEATPTELPAATEVPASSSSTVEPVATDIPAADATAAEEPTLLEIMEQIPAQTDIVVLDATGEAISLATQEAADAIVEGDPMWCPAGAITVTANCVNAATVSALLPLLASKNEDGVIYFYTPTIYSTNDVSIDGTNLDIDQLADNALTIQGGWNGVTTLGSTITFSGNSIFSVPIQIINWNGDVTVQNITIQGASGREGLRVLTSKDIDLKNITLQNGYTTGLEARTSQDITIENFNALNNWNGWGGYINNTPGTGTVTIKGTNNFSNNTWGGIWVNSRGNANISGITASNNSNDDGVEIWHYDGNLFISDVNASNNGQTGLKINTNGVGTLNNVAANYNGIYGTYLDNTSSSSNATVTLAGTNTFNGNNNTGLYVLSDGNIAVNNITANNSTTGMGIDLNNTSGAGSVSLTGTNVFTGNKTNGLNVASNGAVTLDNVTASSNLTGYGATIDNTTSSSNATVTLTGTNIFNGNSNTGLYVHSDGNVSAANVSTSNNGGHGAAINNTTSSSNATVTLTGINTFNGNHLYGLIVISDGNIYASNVTASSNLGYGAFIDNTTSSSSATVMLTGTNIFSGNYFTGFRVFSDGNVSANNVTASSNLTGYGAFIDNTFSSSNATVTLTGTNTFNGNYNTGLYVLSDGNITVNNVTANNSTTGMGVNLNNTSGVGSVYMARTNIFNGNKNTGLYVLSNGNISASNITSSTNGKDGAYLSTFGNVTVTNSAFSGNQIAPYSGLAVFNSASTTISNSVFEDNYFGAYFGNVGDIVITNSVFSQNLNTGLHALSNGNATLNAVTANGNSNAGVYVNTANNKNITIETITANNNCTGLHTVGSNDVHVAAESITGNGLGFLAENSSNSYYLQGTENVTGNIVNITGYRAQCTTGMPGWEVTNLYVEPTPTTPAPTTIPDSTVTPAPTATPATVIIDISNFDEANDVGAQTEFAIDCINQQRYVVNLPNDDQVQVVCPVSGKAHISRRDNTTLPADLPAGYVYASAFSLDIIRGEKPISVIDENGYIKVSFNIPSLEAGTTYSVLYWDNGTWTPLKDFMIDENGNPRGFNLHADDQRKILSGSNFIFEEGSPTRLEISTNFPGIFVLAQH